METMAQSIIYEIFRSNVRARMAKLKLRQEDLAKVLGCTQGHVSYVLSGRTTSPGIELVARFANALGTTPDQLLKPAREKIPA